MVDAQQWAGSRLTWWSMVAQHYLEIGACDGHAHSHRRGEALI